MWSHLGHRPQTSFFQASRFWASLSRHHSETLAVDRPHPSQACIQYDKAISHMELAREKEERSA
ncbi:hypothetical protein DPMN_105743 [Dreissena polymorpha]|uniref:Uncharacterized protein n=1 Tax=Dreissena polymorpha TaxID=45954 RepID=A0A9D4QIZ6_DREPO|nr:hypothetical protein DPMN_105743 [Dreissena polymorpha]